MAVLRSEYFVSFYNNFWDLIFLDDRTFCGGLLCGKKCPEYFLSFDNNFWDQLSEASCFANHFALFYQPRSGKSSVSVGSSTLPEENFCYVLFLYFAKFCGGVQGFKTRQNGLQNNWLLRAYMATIQEIEQHSKHYFPPKRPQQNVWPFEIFVNPRKCY